MNRIDALSLVNFKAFDEMHVPLGGLALLSGLNGSGKSSVVQALGLLRQSFDTGSLASGEIALNGGLVEIGTGGDLIHQGFNDAIIEIGLDVKTPDGDVRLEWRADVGLEYDVLRCSFKPDDLTSADANLFSRGFQYLRADRITPSVAFPKSHHAIGREGFLGTQGEYTAHFLQRFGEEKQVETSRRQVSSRDAPGLISQVNAWMQIFSPGVRVEPEAVAMTDFVRLAYSYRGTGTAYGKPMRPTNVGFGLTHALPVVTACLAAEPGSLIVIENPEAQLHPRGQAAMGLLLATTAAAGVQVIAETHSDHVLNGIRIAAKRKLIAPAEVKLHFFERAIGAPSRLETPELLADGRLSFWPEDYFDQWERSLDELLD